MRPKFTILLSASVPSRERNEKFRKVPNAQIQIEQAVIALTRNVFQAGGKLIFGGHPSISPLVIMIAMEYDRGNKEIGIIPENEPPPKPINIYQSKAFQELIPRQTFDLLDLGYAEITWTDAVNEEKCNPEIKDQSQCPQSLKFMREEMTAQNIDALVCIGGMEGVMDEFNLFLGNHPDKPIYVFETTGGASEILAEKYSNLNNIRITERVNYKYPGGKTREDNEPEKIKIIPYTFFTALLIKDLLENRNL